MRFGSAVIPVSELKRWYQQGFVVPLVESIPLSADSWTIAKRVLGKRNVFFLDSVRYQKKTARYSYLGWNPFRVVRFKQVKDPIGTLRSLFRLYRGRRWSALPFFTGGAVGYFSYELAHHLERLPDLAQDDLRLDQMALLFVRTLAVFDEKKKRCFLAVNLIPAHDGSFREAFQKASQAIEQSRKELFKPPAHPNGFVRVHDFESDQSKADFKRMVRRAKRYIEAGDIYQANLSQRFSFRFEGNAEGLYESLRRINPSPFSSFIKIGPLTVASCSPERLIRKVGDRCETRPIAGTKPRGVTPAQDERFRHDLVKSAKERAEHLMLVDLERNDLGRVARAKSVRVNEFMTLERYSHVVHIVSNVVAKLKKGYDQFDLFRAVFPGGTITGCPKIRSMEIIEELEPFKRHLYTGSIGYLDFNGDMDLNIVIRSLILCGHKGYLQVGAGIVHDSDPESEYWETLHKGKALIDALYQHV